MIADFGDSRFLVPSGPVVASFEFSAPLVSTGALRLADFGEIAANAADIKRLAEKRASGSAHRNFDEFLRAA